MRKVVFKDTEMGGLWCMEFSLNQFSVWLFKIMSSCPKIQTKDVETEWQCHYSLFNNFNHDFVIFKQWFLGHINVL